MDFTFSSLPKPFLALAPMEDVTDRVFRGLIADLAPPDVFFTEFISAPALAAQRKTTMAALSFTPKEEPLIAQIWGNDPETFYAAARLLSQRGYSGIDINMGCPAKKIVKKGACAGLIGNTSRTQELVLAVREGIESTNKKLPVSIKTRLGLTQNTLETWGAFLLELHPDAITLHPRTAIQMSEGSADWNQIRLLSDMRNQLSPSTTIIGNGDILSYQAAHTKAAASGADGVMIGRGIFYNPYVFSQYAPPLQQRPRQEKLQLALQHTRRFEASYSSTRNFEILKKFYKCYISAYDGWEEDFYRLTQVSSYTAAYTLLEQLLNQQPT